MKRKQLLGIIVFAIIITGIAIIVNRQKASPTMKQNHIGTELFPDLAVNEISAIHIEQPGAKSILVRRKAESWKVESRYNYPADFNRVAEFIKTISSLKNKQHVKASTSQYTRLNLAPPDASNGAGIRLELTTANGKTAGALIAGNYHLKKGDSEENAGMQWPAGRYLLLQSPDKRLALVDQTLRKLDESADAWLDKKFISVDKPRLAQLSQKGKIVWSLYRSQASDELAPEMIPDGTSPDRTKIASIDRALANLSFASIADPKMPDSETGLDNPRLFRAETFSGKAYELQIGKEHEGKYYVRVNISQKQIPKPVPADDISEEDKQKIEQEYQEKIAETTEELREQQQMFSPWIYLIDQYAINPMITTQDELFPKKERSEEHDTKTEDD